MLSLILAIVFPIVLTSAAIPTNQTAYCERFDDILSVYQHPNASSSYSIPAVVSTGSTVMNSADKTWQIVNIFGNVSDSTFNAKPHLEQLSQYIYLDTSSTINTSALSSPLPFAGCAFRFELPSSYVGKTSGDGSCGRIFGQSCLNEIMQIAQDATVAIPSAAGSSKLIDACDTVSETVNNYLLTGSSKVCSNDGPAIAVTQGLNFSYAATSSCTNPPTSLPLTLLSQQEPFEQANFTTYDRLTKTTTPILLAIFSNGTTMNGTGDSFARTSLICTSPMNVTAGSRDPTSAAVHSVVAGVKSVVVGFALAINALVFLML